MRIKSVGNAASIFLAVSFAICMIWGMIAPANLHMHGAWEDWLPGFSFDAPSTWLLGLVETYLYGWYVALLFVPLYNYFSKER